MTTSKTDKTCGTVFIPQDVQKQIDYLHNNYHGQEWSGILVYITDKADFEILDNFSFKVLGIYPMNLGSGAFTEFDYENAMAEIYSLYAAQLAEELEIDEIEAIERIKTGLVHSHHTGQAYFSGTDMDELRQNAPKHNYYLSLVVNTREKYAAKVAVPATTAVEKEYKIRDDSGNPVHLKSVSSSEITIFDKDLKIEIDQDYDVPAWFAERFEDLEEKKRTLTQRSWQPTAAYGSYSPGYGGYKKSYPAGASAPLPAYRSGVSDKKKDLQDSTSKAVKELDQKIEQFGHDLLCSLMGQYYESASRAVKEAAILEAPSDIGDKFDFTFNSLYIKTFGAKPETEAELEFVVEEMLLWFDIYDDDYSMFAENSFLNYLKDLLYGKIEERAE